MKQFIQKTAAIINVEENYCALLKGIATCSATTNPSTLCTNVRESIREGLEKAEKFDLVSKADIKSYLKETGEHVVASCGSKDLRAGNALNTELLSFWSQFSRN